MNIEKETGTEDAIGRERVAFAVGLLAIILALAPVYERLRKVRMLIFGDEFRLRAYPETRIET